MMAMGGHVLSPIARIVLCRRVFEASFLSSSPSTTFTKYRCCFCGNTLINQPFTGAKAPNCRQLDRQAQISTEFGWFSTKKVWEKVQ